MERMMRVYVRLAFDCVVITLGVGLGCRPSVTPSDAPKPLPSVKESNPRGVCDVVCDAMRTLGCHEADGIAGGASCVTFCKMALGDRRLRLDPFCVARATTVAEMRACKVRCIAK
jgi:hypothetical protein